MARTKGPSVTTAKRLFAVSGNRCAHRQCKRALVDEDTGVVTGVICHIKAASPKGPRYDARQTDKQRHAFENLLLMCADHHKVIDSRPRYWTVDRLQELKLDHEAGLGRQPSEALTSDQARQLLANVFVQGDVHQLAIAQDGSVVIQIDGDRNTVMVGGARLLDYETPAARRRGLEKSLGDSDLLLLRADAGVTKHIGVDEVRDDFLDWAKADSGLSPLSIRTLTGPAGAGKTRFALEILARLAANTLDGAGKLAADGWAGGFVDLDIIAKFDMKGEFTQITWPAPTLLVVDYAEAGGELMKVWLNYLGRRLSPNSAQVRVLLLARTADPGESWLLGLQGFSSDGAPGLETSFHPSEPIALPPLKTPTDRRQVLQATLDAFAKKKKNVPPLPQPGENPWFDKLLNVPQWGQPQCLMMAAAVACRSGSADPVVDALSMSRVDLAVALAEREKTRLRRGVKEVDRRRLRVYLAACATLARGLSEDEAVRAADVVIEQSHIDCSGGGNALVHDLRKCLGAPAGGIAPVEPDIIGEAFVYLAFRGRGEDDLPLVTEQIGAILLALLGQVQREDAGEIRLFMHLIQDFAATWPDLLEWLDQLVPKCRQELFPLLLRIADGLPEQTLVLMERAADIHQTILCRLQSMESPADSLAHSSQVATALNNLAGRLSDLGRREEALGSAQEAVTIMRTLAERRPDAFLPDLAGSLNNLANRLSDLGRREEALDSAQEAVTIRRGLAERRPNAFLTGLATSLSNLAIMLGELGRREEAIQTAQEAVTIRRVLVERGPDAFLPDLAASLNNLASMLSLLGRREEALQNAQEAVMIYRTLAKRRPDAFLPDLATSLGTLHVCHMALAQLAEARMAIGEAMRLLTPLFGKLPQAFAPLMDRIVRGYVKVSREAGEPLDEGALAPIVATFEGLRQQEGQGTPEP